MQIEKNQGKISFRIVGANFYKICINFKHFARIYIRGCEINLADHSK